MNGNYSYRPLLKQENIRVLVLQPAPNLIDTLICTLEEVEPEKASYTALSYCWAMEDDTNSEQPPDSSPTEPMLVHYIKVTIGRNLRDALRRLRQQIQPSSIWADAICINQQDNDEKSKQVAMMGSIYKLAERVVTWLGEGEERLNEGAYRGLMCLVAEENARTSSDSEWELGHIWGPGSGEPSIPNCDACWSYFRDLVARNVIKAENDLEDQKILIREGLEMLDKKRYKNRVWVIQEVALPEAHRLWTNWGAYTIQHNIFRLLFDRYHVTNLTGNHGQVLVVPNTWDLSMRYLPPPGSSLLEFVVYCSAKLCFDPRDKLFGVIGMAAPNTGIELNYSLSVEDVHVLFARYLLATHNLHFLLTNCWPFKLEVHSHTIPTWMPDLAQGCFSFATINPGERDEYYWEHIQPSVSSDGRVLSCAMYYFGTLRLDSTGKRFHVVWEAPMLDNSLTLTAPRHSHKKGTTTARRKIFALRGFVPRGKEWQSGDIFCSFDPFMEGRRRSANTLPKCVLRPGPSSQWQIIGGWSGDKDPWNGEPLQDRDIFLHDAEFENPEQRLLHIV